MGRIRQEPGREAQKSWGMLVNCSSCSAHWGAACRTVTAAAPHGSWPLRIPSVEFVSATVATVGCRRTINPAQARMAVD
jgi:hypothetical protein